MLMMNRWVLAQPTRMDAQLGFVGENNAQLLQLVVDELGAWSYKLDLLYRNGTTDIIDLMPSGHMLVADISAATLRQDGTCKVQVRGVDGDVVKKSNMVAMAIRKSVLDADIYKDGVPSEFYQMEAQITKARDEVMAATEVVAAATSAVEKNAAYVEEVVAGLNTEMANTIDGGWIMDRDI